MRFRNLYYTLKPLLPWGLRMGVRRYFAKRKLRKASDIWPILPGSEKPPENWPGWPENKQFAFVLTHDVEGQKGLDNVRKLAELEMELGFRSSFNFVPEGEYEVPDELVAWLKENGFEVGVHDHRHDGKLYRSKSEFRKSAQRINHYIKKWGAVGFRSGFMLRNLDWLHQLDIEYDASTFDTDPFEPQPDGLGTIFPLWIERKIANHSSLITTQEGSEISTDKGSHSPSSDNPISDQRLSISDGSSTYPDFSGYVELPYTLPQDSTLFLVFQEADSGIWKRKLDWLATKGGMALLNTHPDYYAFRNNKSSATEFAPERYREFLNYLKNNYENRYWHVLPKEVASYCRPFKPENATRPPKNICMLAFTDYESDGRIIRYAQTLVDRGDTVDVIACARENEPLSVTDSGGATLYKIYNRKSNPRGGAISYFLPLIRFALKAFFVITRNQFKRSYDVIHVHNIPEWLVFSAWIPKLRGAKIILDLHDLVPELFSAKFNKGNRSKLDSSLKLLERWSCSFSDHVIISNDLWSKTIEKRSADPDRCSVFINNIDPKLFYPRIRMRSDDKKIVIFPGTLQWHQGVDIVIRAFPKIKAAIPEAEFHIYGGGGVVHELKELVKDLGLEKTVLFRGSVSIIDMPQIIADADVGVVPKRSDSFGNEAYSTKIMEFMSQRVPTVISRTAIDDFYFNDSVTRFCESGNVDEFADAIIEMLTNKALREEIIKNACDYVSKNDWNSKRQDYLDIVDNLINSSSLSTSDRQSISSNSVDTCSINP